jgi:eukaryotic-like serine/threonine-protein kinase
VLGIVLTIVSLAVCVPALWRAFGPTEPVPYAVADVVTRTETTTPTATPVPSPIPTTTTSPPTSSVESGPGQWIAQLASLRRATPSAEVERRRADIAKRTGLDVLDSSEFASLVPGYWVIYFPGNFADGHQALATCRERGRTTEQSCVGRYLSHAEADRNLVCRFSDAPTARRCARR